MFSIVWQIALHHDDTNWAEQWKELLIHPRKCLTARGWMLWISPFFCFLHFSSSNKKSSSAENDIPRGWTRFTNRCYISKWSWRSLRVSPTGRSQKEIVFANSKLYSYYNLTTKDNVMTIFTINGHGHFRKTNRIWCYIKIGIKRTSRLSERVVKYL